MENYVRMSLETHLFFARIMKEHALFLEAGFPCVNTEWIRRADWFKQEFENLLREVVQMSNGRVGKDILQSSEVVTEFTLSAERATEQLSGVAIDSRISMQQQGLRPRRGMDDNMEMTRVVRKVNERAKELLDDFIDFKEKILEEVGSGNVFNANYPLLVQHILREARLYCELVKELLENEQISQKCLRETESFWNRIMMEHAFFIRGLLDPAENELIRTANDFAGEYKELLEKASAQDCKAMGLTKKSLETTMRYRDFKAAGTEGILGQEIASLILPLLADHVLREANHYIRLLETGSEA